MTTTGTTTTTTSTTTSSTVLVTTAVTIVTSCDGMLGVASDVGGVHVGVGLEGTGVGPGNGRAVRGGSAK